ncbi:MAG: hypothetical protein AB8F65_12885 [Woeseiaceae bacterium]
MWSIIAFERVSAKFAISLMLSLLACLAFAQDTENADADVDESVTEEASPDNTVNDSIIQEIVVLAPFPDGPLSLDPFYDDPLNIRVRREVESLMRDPEAEDWRTELAEETESRVKLGYDPRDEYQFRNKIELDPQLNGTVKPATVLRIEF